MKKRKNKEFPLDTVHKVFCSIENMTTMMQSEEIKSIIPTNAERMRLTLLSNLTSSLCSEWAVKYHELNKGESDAGK